jgi:putative IMPACT (imprinted ancient) family translation regulator
MRATRIQAGLLFIALSLGSLGLASCAADDPAATASDGAITPAAVSASPDDGEAACTSGVKAMSAIHRSRISDSYSGVVRTDAEVMASVPDLVRAYSTLNTDLVRGADQTTLPELKAAMLAYAVESEKVSTVLKDPAIDLARVRAAHDSATFLAAQRAFLAMCLPFNVN